MAEKNYYTEEERYWKAGGNTGTLPHRITPTRINVLREGEIFVFGSNKQGMHGGGAARVAVDKFGAEWGNGEGLQGQSYALPTMEGAESMQEAINRFGDFAAKHPELKFYMTLIGCGIAGYKPAVVAKMLRPYASLENVYYPLRFWKIWLKADE